MFFFFFTASFFFSFVSFRFLFVARAWFLSTPVYQSVRVIPWKLFCEITIEFYMQVKRGNWIRINSYHGVLLHRKSPRFVLVANYLFLNPLTGAIQVRERDRERERKRIIMNILLPFSSFLCCLVFRFCSRKQMFANYELHYGQSDVYYRKRCLTISRIKLSDFSQRARNNSTNCKRRIWLPVTERTSDIALFPGNNCSVKALIVSYIKQFSVKRNLEYPGPLFENCHCNIDHSTRANRF